MCSGELIPNRALFGMLGRKKQVDRFAVDSTTLGQAVEAQLRRFAL